MKNLILVLGAAFIFQACAGGGGSPGLPAAPGAPGAPEASDNPGAGRPESANFFSGVDTSIAASAKGDKLIAERFYTIMARASVYAIICDFKNVKGWSARVSKLWNSSTELQALAEKVYGGQTPAYNRFEKQRNIESKRLSFNSGADACAVGEPSFNSYSSLSAAQLSNTVHTTPRGSL
jgi:hypothetical protein